MKQILICDDDPVDIKLFTKLLAKQNKTDYIVTGVNTRADLFAKLKEPGFRPDILFLDFYLRETTGLEILKDLKSTKRLPVVMLTGLGDQDTAVQCMKEGATDYLSKDSLAASDLVKIIEQAISRWGLEQERDQLLGITAHELRNPISVILGYTEIMQHYTDLDNAKKMEMIDIIRERANHLLNIINHLLDITRIEKGLINFKPESTNLCKLIDKIISDFSFPASRKNITISVVCPDKEISIYIDPNRMQEVIANFIDNAVKYSRANTHITVTIIKAEETVTISVQDQGLGIMEHELQYLFDLFSSKKISTTPTGDESKTGLGLAICRKVVDAHNGKIEVQSKVGEGSTFTIILPVNINPETFLN